MLTRLIATIAALTLIGLAAALPALAQSSADSSGSGAAAPTTTATATATPTATPAPGPASFALSDARLSNLKLRGLTRIADKWYVTGYGAPRTIHVFEGDGTYEKSLNISRHFQGLTTDGTNLIGVDGSWPEIFTWDISKGGPLRFHSAVFNANLPSSNGYLAKGLAYDGTNTWVAALQPRSGAAALVKVSDDGPDGAAGARTFYRVNAVVKSLVHRDGFLYATRFLYSSPDTSRNEIDSGDLLRIKISDLSASKTNIWEIFRRDAGIRGGLVFHDDGAAYGFSGTYDEVRRARQPSPERLFALTPTIGDQLPHGITRVGDKWHIAGHSGDGYVSIFSNTGTYERRIKAPDATIRGLASDGTSLFAAANSTANAISVADNSSVAVYVPKIYKWTPQANETASASATTFCIPNALGYTPNGVAYDAGGTHIWVALDSSSRNILVKLNATTGAHLGTYRMNNAVSGLTYKNGNLYGLSDGNIVMAVASHLKTSPATWVNNWEVVKRDSGLSNGLVFRDRTAYGFNAAQDEVRSESGSPTIAAAPASPAGVASLTGSVPPTGADPSDAAAPAPNPATPSSGADANPSG